MTGNPLVATKATPALILASGSGARRTMLANAGLAFDVVPSRIDERIAEAPLVARGASPAEIATALAEAKAVDVSRTHPGAWVVGADQTLDLDGHRGTKSETREAAAAQLARLAGRTHRLHSAVAVARDGALLWSHTESAALTVRAMTASEIEAYLDRVGPDVLSSVGVYQIEGEGIRLFDRVEGDTFTILGLPLVPLLVHLRSEGVIA